MFRDGKYVLFAAITLVFIQCCTAGNITYLEVPSWVRNGTEDRVLLDCKYNYTLNEEKFVLKWYFNNDRQAAYQWIPNLNSRSFSDHFKSFADWEHYLPDADKFNRYRQIILKRPTTEFTGEYKCHVTSKEHSDEQSAYMTVYAPARRIKVNYNMLPDKMVNISCEVDGVFPKPEVELFYLLQDKAETKRKVLDINEDFFDRTDDSYRIGMSAVISVSELDKVKYIDFICLVTIGPKVHQDQNETRFHPVFFTARDINALEKQKMGRNNNSSSRTSPFFLVIFIFIIILLIC